jgi:hypothetical protein
VLAVLGWEHTNSNFAPWDPYSPEILTIVSPVPDRQSRCRDAGAAAEGLPYAALVDAHRNAGHALFDKWIIQYHKLNVRTLARLRLKLWSSV